MYLLCEDVFFHHGIQTINSFNVNEAAGQSIFHVHIHLISRYKGDVENPKGEVRGVIPSKQKYWYCFIDSLSNN